MHSLWCGKECEICKTSCVLDESIPCSPDCEFLGKDGETDHIECKTCGVYEEDEEDN